MKILVAIDRPATAEEIIAFAKDKHWFENAEVKAVYVMAPIVLTDAMAPIPTQAVQVIYDNAAAIMHEAAGKFEAVTGHKPDISIPFGDPAHVIVEEAKEWRADLVVLASHNLPAWERFLSGSVSKFVAEHVDSPVLVLKAIKTNH